MASSNQRRHIIAVAIDFGTTFSGYAFSLTAEYESNPTKITTRTWNSTKLISHKAPTCILIENDGKTARAFGYDAESLYAEDPQRNSLYLFRRFKMLLDMDKGLNKDVMMKDVQGKSLPAFTVISLSIRCLKADVDKMIGNSLGTTSLKPSEIIWVLTVPAIWNDAAKQFMREAATHAGIPDTYLKIALEPEAAALFCRHLPYEHFRGEYVNLSSLPTGEQYMVLDAGGGTVDITIHEVVNNQTVKEIEAASGGPWGGVTVDKAYFKFLEDITGPGFLDKLRAGMFEDELELVQAFEIQKRKISPAQTKPVQIRIPIISFNEICNVLFNEDFATRLMHAGFGDKVILKRDILSLHPDLLKQFYGNAIEKIIHHVNDLLERPTVSNCNTIIMVGGFSECEMLQEAIKKSCLAKKVIIPADAGLMVLKGAVVFGHDSSVISQRISKHTYGAEIVVNFDSNKHPASKKYLFNYCKDIFCPFVKAGQSLKVGHPSAPIGLKPLLPFTSEMQIQLYAFKGGVPEFVTDEGCLPVGTIMVPLSFFDFKNNVQVQVILGGTELQVQCTHESTGNITTKFINFLG